MQYITCAEGYLNQVLRYSQVCLVSVLPLYVTEPCKINMRYEVFADSLATKLCE